MKTYVKVGEEYILAYDSEAVMNAKEAVIKALEDVRADVGKADFDFGDYYDHTETIKQWFGDLIDRKIEEIKK